MNKDKILFWAPLLSGAIVGTCIIYCMFFWEPHPMSWKNLDCSILCWFYCATLKPLIAAPALILSGVSILVGMLHHRFGEKAIRWNILIGILFFPTGLLNLWAAWLQHQRELGNSNKI